MTTPSRACAAIYPMWSRIRKATITNTKTFRPSSRRYPPKMAALGLSFRWRTDSDDGVVKVSCIISHRDGHSEETTLSAKPDGSGSKNAIQAIGSAVTYLQRYTLKAALGIAASKDDDGAAAGRALDDKPAQTKTISKDEQARAIYTMHQRELRLCTTKDQLREAWKTACADKEFIPVDWQRELRTEMEARLAEIEAITSDDDFPGDLTDAKSHLDRIHEDTAA